MTETDQNFTLYQGEDKDIQIDVTEDGSPKDMTGMTPAWYLFASAGDEKADALLTKVPTIGNGAGTNDRLSFSIDNADTVDLAPVTYYHEARVVDALSNEKVVATGIVTIEPSPSSA